MKVNYCGRKRQEEMIKNGWKIKVRKDCRETPEQMYKRLQNDGYSKIKVYWEAAMIRGYHDYFAFVKW